MFNFLSKAGRILGHAIKYACIAHCTFEYIGDVVICSGPSMEPTLYSDNILLTERFSVRSNCIERGDIIIAKLPTNPIVHICKRVVGLPGDKIILRTSFNFNPFSNSNKHNSKVEYNYETDENNFDESTNDLDNFGKYKIKSGEFIVPRGYIWIEGDNPENSLDSRYHGPIPQALIRSRAVCRLWPLKDMTMFS